jgi:hypothetical protein
VRVSESSGGIRGVTYLKKPIEPDDAASDAISEAVEAVATHDDTAKPDAAEPLEPTTSSLPPKGPVRIVPLLVTGIGAAVLGAVGAVLLLPIVRPAPSVDVVGLEAALTAQSAHIQALNSELMTLKALPPSATDLSPLQATLDALREKIDALEAAPEVVAPSSDDGMKALRDEIASLREQLAQTSAPGSDEGALRARIEAEMQAELAPLKVQAEELQAAAEAALALALKKVALAQFEAALETGSMLPQAVSAVKAAGIELPADLTGEVPSIAELRAAFPDAARFALAEARRASPGSGFWERLRAFVLIQTGARSLEPRDGIDPDAILSRAEAAVANADINAALAEIATLQDPARAAMAQWAALAERRLAATSALVALTHSLN